MNYDYVKKLLFMLDPEHAHTLAESTLRAVNFLSPALLNFLAKNYIVDDENLKQELCGLEFYNPVGLAGGFDKNATMIRPLSAFGFGFLEFGTLTPNPQKGNEKPRLFRLKECESLQNAMGFNNEGKAKIAARLRKIYPFILPLGANIGKNKSTKNEEAIGDYLSLFEAFENLSDYFVINISSPNTKNLRALQNEDFITKLLEEARKITQKPIFIKLAPDMKINEAFKICEVALKQGANGFILANTSVDYSLLDTARTFGGLSGQIIKAKSAKFFKDLASKIYEANLADKCLLIASGGIADANDAYERIKNGANLVQIYTSFIYKGPSVVKDINEGLKALLQKDKFNHISEAVGINFKKGKK